MKKISYGLGKKVPYSFDEAIQRVTEALAEEGFGILTKIDVTDTLEKKIGKKIPAYQILGACNPHLAAQAIEQEPSIGLLLPCNVVVRQDDAGKVYVEIMDPEVVLSMVDNPEIHQVARDVRGRVERILNTL